MSDPVSAIANAVGDIFTAIPAIMGIRTERRFAKEEIALRERLAIWDSWFDQACKTGKTVAEIAYNDPTSQGAYIRSFGSFQNWFTNDGNFRSAYTVYLNYVPNADLYSNQHCPNYKLLLIVGGGLLLLLFILIATSKK